MLRTADFECVLGERSSLDFTARSRAPPSRVEVPRTPDTDGARIRSSAGGHPSGADSLTPSAFAIVAVVAGARLAAAKGLAGVKP